MPRCAVQQAPVLGGDAVQIVDPAALDEQADQPQRPAADAAARAACPRSRESLAQRHAPGCARRARPSGRPSESPRRVEVVAPARRARRRAGRARRRPRRSGAAAVVGRAISVAPSAPSDGRTPAGSARNSSTSRRWRSVRHGLADDAAGGLRGRGRRPRPGARRGRAVFSASISLVARSRRRSSSSRGRGDVCVARLLGDLLGAGQDLVRLAASLAEGGQALLLGATRGRAAPAPRPGAPARSARGGSASIR